MCYGFHCAWRRWIASSEGKIRKNPMRLGAHNPNASNKNPWKNRSVASVLSVILFERLSSSRSDEHIITQEWYQIIHMLSSSLCIKYQWIKNVFANVLSECKYIVYFLLKQEKWRFFTHIYVFFGVMGRKSPVYTGFKKSNCSQSHLSSSHSSKHDALPIKRINRGKANENDLHNW